MYEGEKMPRKKKRSSNSMLPIGLAAIGLILIGFAFLSFQTTRLPPSAAPAIQHSEEDTFPEVERVSLDEARKALDSQTAVFVDVRDAADYAAAHIPGALSIPLGQLDERADELNRSDWIIAYCT
jgi:3-mercaptopyruvate sulfurtransferase SseA